MIENLIVYLLYFLKTWKKNGKDIVIVVMAMQTRKLSKPEYKNSLRILAAKINLAKVID